MFWLVFRIDLLTVWLFAVGERVRVEDQELEHRDSI
jgi:hypothetical protein